MARFVAHFEVVSKKKKFIKRCSISFKREVSLIYFSLNILQTGNIVILLVILIGFEQFMRICELLFVI